MGKKSSKFLSKVSSVHSDDIQLGFDNDVENTQPVEITQVEVTDAKQNVVIKSLKKLLKKVLAMIVCLLRSGLVNSTTVLYSTLM